MKVLQVDTFSEPQAQANCWGLFRAYSRVAETKAYDYRKRHEMLQDQKLMNRELVETALKFHPDIIHFDKCEIVLGRTIKRIREGLPDAYLYQLFGDLKSQVKPYVAAIGPHVNRTVFYYEDKGYFKMHEDSGCHGCAFWPNGADPEVFKPLESSKRWDVLFYGNGYKRRLTKERVAFIKALAAEGFRVRVLGEQWDSWFKRHSVSLGPFKDMAELNEEINASRIVLAFNQDNVRLYTSWRRPLMSMAAGAFVLTRYFPGLETIFGQEKHLAWFSSVEDGIAKAKFYLGHSARRKEIAKTGRAEVLAKHTWDHRVAQVLVWAKEAGAI